MPGIYIHIPFCKQACHYCDFHFSTSLNNKQAFISALQKEISMRRDYLGGSEIDTIYFGGGTPSLLNGHELMEIYECLEDHFKISPNAEITLEANPDDLVPARLSELRKSPVNRLSIGIQSFQEEDLRWMNRAHNSEEAERCVKQAQDAGFSNITIDLIYGIPGLEDADWRKNLRKAFALDIQHISAYSLTVEARTALAKFVKEGSSPAPDDERSTEQFRIMKEEMRWNDFVQYEISNFGKQGFFSRHNSSYWKGEPYLGLGPSAHSYNTVSRQWNKPNNNVYIRSVEAGKPEMEIEVLHLIQQYNEYVMTGLRTMWGCDLAWIQERFGPELAAHCRDESEFYIQKGLVVQREEKLILTEEGMLFADRIASDLFQELISEK